MTTENPAATVSSEATVAAQATENTEATEVNDKLFVLWTSQDPEVAKHMVFMYTKNAKLQDWWSTVRLIV